VITRHSFTQTLVEFRLGLLAQLRGLAWALRFALQWVPALVRVTLLPRQWPPRAPVVVIEAATSLLGTSSLGNQQMFQDPEALLFCLSFKSFHAGCIEQAVLG